MGNDINFLIEECLREGRKQFYIYPYERNGMQIEETLIRRYGVETVILVDNYICKYNPKVISCRMLEEVVWDEEDIVLIASNSCEYYGNIRLEIEKYVPIANIKDIYPLNPLLTNADQRIASLAAVAREIYRKKISRSVSEAGVYRGDFAKYINMLFPDRKLFLFDSSEGFDEKSVADGYDNSEQTDACVKRLKDTSVDIVMKK